MEINITKFFNEACPKDYSASVAEIGLNAGDDTWGAAKEAADGDYNLLDTSARQEAFKRFIDGHGAWEPEEVAKWSLVELNALFIQFISGDIRESAGLTNRDWELYETESKEGQCSGRIYKTKDGEIYYELGQ